MEIIHKSHSSGRFLIVDRRLRTLRIGNFDIPLLRFSTFSFPPPFVTRNTNTKLNSFFFSRRNNSRLEQVFLLQHHRQKTREQRGIDDEKKRKDFLTLKEAKSQRARMSVNPQTNENTRKMRLFMYCVTCGFVSNDEQHVKSVTVKKITFWVQFFLLQLVDLLSMLLSSISVHR